MQLELLEDMINKLYNINSVLYFFFFFMIFLFLKEWCKTAAELLQLCPAFCDPMDWSPEKAMAPHSSTLAWKIPWTEEPGVLQSIESLGIGHNWATSLSCIGEGNGNPLQCSCLENPRDGGAWWAAVYGVAQSRTWLKWLSSRTGACQGPLSVGFSRKKF